MNRRQAERLRRAKTAGMMRLHNERRRAGVCINNADHGKAHRGGRCRRCWMKKLAAEREAYQVRRARELRLRDEEKQWLAAVRAS